MFIQPLKGSIGGPTHMSKECIITIARQFGSGGREIGEALAKALGVKCYDKELISLAAKESGVDPEVFNNVDEKATNSLLYSLSMGLYSFGTGFNADRLPVNDKLYLLQHKIIKKLRFINVLVLLKKIPYMIESFGFPSGHHGTVHLILDRIEHIRGIYGVYRFL